MRLGSIVSGATLLVVAGCFLAAAAQSREQPNPAAYGGLAPVRFGDLEFRLSSAVLSAPDQNHIDIRVTLSASNKGKAVSIFMMQQDTAVSTNTGVTISGHATQIQASGIRSCGEAVSECQRNADRYFVVIPEHVTNSMILNFSTFMADTDLRKTTATADSVDASVVLYLRLPDGATASVPLTFANAPLRNFLK